MNDQATEDSAPVGALATMKAHPVITGIMLSCAITGAVMGFFLLPEEWILARRIAAGAVAGLGVGLTITATKMIG